MVAKLMGRDSPHLVEPRGSLFVPDGLAFLFSLSGMRMRGGGMTTLPFPLPCPDAFSAWLSTAIGWESLRELVALPHPDPPSFCAFPQVDPAFLSPSLLFPQPDPDPSFCALPQMDSAFLLPPPPDPHPLPQVGSALLSVFFLSPQLDDPHPLSPVLPVPVALSASLSLPQPDAPHLPPSVFPHPPPHPPWPSSVFALAASV